MLSGIFKTMLNIKPLYTDEANYCEQDSKPSISLKREIPYLAMKMLIIHLSQFSHIFTVFMDRCLVTGVKIHKLPCSLANIQQIQARSYERSYLKFSLSLAVNLVADNTTKHNTIYSSYISRAF
jgi:gamma-glutamyl phosphate reductase